ncbi:MAG: hypothetical protein J2P25_03525 [Nocardiopsaceae bacterium]|nr:hypothetical protein [Nocardiopsaceae bacterium]
MRVGIQVQGQAEAVSELCATFDRYRQGSIGCSWWPGMISLRDYVHGTAGRGRQARPSWCYGTPGQVRAQQLAAGTAWNGRSPRPERHADGGRAARRNVRNPAHPKRTPRSQQRSVPVGRLPAANRVDPDQVKEDDERDGTSCQSRATERDHDRRHQGRTAGRHQ